MVCGYPGGVPGELSILGIAPCVIRSMTVPAEVDKIRGNGKIIDIVRRVRHAETGLIIAAEIHHGWNNPGFMPEFEGVAKRILLQQFQEGGESIEVQLELGRELPENDGKFFLQAARRFQKIFRVARPGPPAVSRGLCTCCP